MKLHDLIRLKGVALGMIGGLLMVCGVIGFFIEGEFLGVRNFYNWFFVANSFIFMGIFFLLWFMNCQTREKKD